LTPINSEQPAPREPKGLQWPAFVVGLLLLNVSVCAITVISAVIHPAQVEPDYYDRALNWDESRGIDTTSQTTTTDPS